ncbi:related to ubiquitin carboxyl-terminal hydrolase [Rhynchosporium graminicola]|uniref:Related to ubiquitin carboxyl-terminal hydrolase n=1 Tax=Rhynchosporium graminicola TaxID=2792576 RepID=A0A1E1KFW0_9HELO|nr:related to ubiquitin carboxyl-terminal hydrolase [Rhynchosporium commune]
MSPAATGGPPYTRSTSVHGGPVGMAQGSGRDDMEGLKGGNRILPHLDDLVAVAPSRDIMHWSMRRLLQEGELLAKQADTHLDFRKPDMALQEYIKATIIAVEYVPRHKDYPSLQSDRGELHRMYAGLNKRITAQHSRFAEVKEIIKQNNARSGVKPAVSRSNFQVEDAEVITNGHTRTQSVPNGPTNGMSANPNRKKPPPVLPKPDALHGNAIQGDLAARFARLRSPESNAPPVQQDPRIKTQPIIVPTNYTKSQPTSPTHNATAIRPIGPRAFPSVPKSIPRHIQMPLDVQLPSMPRAPDAIYSPASGVENPSAVNIPSRTRTSSYSHGRKNSAPPVSTVGPTPDVNEGRRDYFSPAHTMSNGDSEPKPPKREAPDLPDGASITAEGLFERLRQPLSILIVDLRTRGEFESGHIMAQSVICIEPMSLRTGVSGDQLGDTLVIHSDYEQSLYERRADFDLIVFYDQSSKSVNSSASFARDKNSTLRDFSAAVYDYGYDKRVKRRPMLLIGGLDAWVDLLGPNSLKSSSKDTAASMTLKSNRAIGRFSRAAGEHRNGLHRTNTRTSRPLTQEEESKWELAMSQEPAPASPMAETPSEEFVYARTLEGFMNKYPEMPVIPESMVSQTSVEPAEARLGELEGTIPRLPTRPAPALPRQRSSGISDRGPDTVTSYASSIAGTSSITQLRVSPGLTGLQNPGYLCYMNSAIQALSATPFLRNYLMNFNYPETLKVPRREGETTDPPQLMTRFTGNLIAHMWGGQYDFLAPTSLSEYMMSIRFKELNSENVRHFCYGGTRKQHDTSEFLLWFTDILDDELNPGRNISNQAGQGVIPLDKQPRLYTIPLIQSSMEAMSILRNGRRSIINQRMDLQECQQTICTVCGAATRVWNHYRQLSLALPTRENRSLQSLLDPNWGRGSSITLNADCDSATCKNASREKRLQRYFSRLPDYLVITLGRFNNDSLKNEAMIDFPETGLDLTHLFCPPDTTPSNVLDREHKGPFLYDVYAVQQHQGSLNSGHYWTVARSPDLPRSNRDGAGSWHKFNDTHVTPSSYAETQKLFTYMIYFVRQGTAMPRN